MTCRICGSRSVTKIAEVEYYVDFACPIYDCAGCGCRFANHDESIYNWLHAQPHSIYRLYRELAAKAKRLFDESDQAGLRAQLSETAKYRFVIESVEQGPKNIRLLEIGCSRGQLAAYFILAGYDILGTDVSADAIAAANAAFGNLFITSDSPLISEKAPYDVIYHTGMIGCVSDPLRTTRELIDLLKPGGRLLFNAPNRKACALRGQVWIDGSAPPDVVALFPPGFWKKHFSESVDVEETIEVFPPQRSFAIGLRRVFGTKWSPPLPIRLDMSADYYLGTKPSAHSGNRLWNNFERVASFGARLTGIARLAPRQATPFGMFVTMTRK